MTGWGWRKARALPGDGLLHPAIIAALALLILNDHVFKTAFPGPMTWKLSDVAGMAFFPALLVGAWEFGLAAFGRWRRPSARAPLVATAATGVAFALVKCSPPGAEAFGWAIGTAQWLLSAPSHAVTGGVAGPAAARVVADPSDLIALPALAIAVIVGMRRAATDADGRGAADLDPVPGAAG
jgi:hypothetical protein